MPWRSAIRITYTTVVYGIRPCRGAPLRIYASEHAMTHLLQQPGEAAHGMRAVRLHLHTHIRVSPQRRYAGHPIQPARSRPSRAPHAPREHGPRWYTSYVERGPPPAKSPDSPRVPALHQGFVCVACPAPQCFIQSPQHVNSSRLGDEAYNVTGIERRSVTRRLQP